MRGNAAASRAMGIHQFIDRAFDSGLRKRVDHDPPFPRRIGFGLPVLDRAAAAGAKISAERHDPFRARGFHAQETPAIRTIGERVGFDDLAAEGIWHEHGLPVCQGDAVAPMADVIDDQALSHGARR
jgi:hypothetical protein